MMILALPFALGAVALLGIAISGALTGTILNLDRSGPLWVSLSADPSAFGWALGLCTTLGAASGIFAFTLFRWSRAERR
jgi:hypothetical protein